MRRLLVAMAVAVAAMTQPAPTALAGAQPQGSYGVLGPPRIVDARSLPRASNGDHPAAAAPALRLHHDVAAATPVRGVATASGTTLEHLTTIAADSYNQQAAFGTDQALAPPDNSVAAGATYVVEFVNSSGWVYTKTGTLHASFDLNGLFSVPTGYSFSDPRLTYDTVSGRWFASGLAFNSSNASREFVGVSTSGDPSSTWFIYTAFTSITELGDQPRIGVSTDKVMLAWDDYRSSNLSIYDGEEERVIDKAALVAGSTPAVFNPPSGPDPTVFGLVPATLNTSGGAIYAFYNDSDATNLVENQGSPKLAYWLVSGTVSSLTVKVAQGYFSTPATTLPPPAPQLGSNRKISTNDDRMLTVTFRGGTIWASANDGCTPAGDTTVRSCLRLWQLTGAAGVSLVQDFDTGQNGTYLFYPAVGIDANGNQVTVFSTSSSSSYPGTSVSGQLAGNTNALGPIGALEAGLGPFTGFTGLCGVNTPCRWGDYFAAAPDPTDTGDVWVAGEYQASSSNVADWGTDVGRVTWSAPAVGGVSPTSGPACTDVTVTGSDFVSGATSVSFGGAAAGGVAVQSPDSLTAVAPAHALGTVDVTTTTADGTSAISSADRFDYVAGPSVSGVSPSSGPGAGGTSVTITGCGFTGATAVDFGKNPAASFTVNSDSSISATSPAGSGTVDVTVTVSGVTSATSSADHFTYNTASAPTVTGLSPTSGATAGGTSVNITGTGFTGATAVHFGAPSATTYTVNSSTSISATSPPGCNGTVDVTVTTPNGTSATSSSDHFTYSSTPAVSSVSPTSGQTSGGTSVTILGSGFNCASAVAFGGVAAAGYSVNSDGAITATSPAHSAGVVDVTVTTGGGTSAANLADKFTFLQTYYFAWFDRISSPGFQNDNIHVVNPGAGTANITVSIPGCPDQVRAVNAGQEVILTCATGFGGPVKIVSDQDLIASQRVQYYQSFNEVPAQPATAAQTNWQFAWYDRISSPGFQNDNIHVVNPGPTAASVTVHIPGQPACDFSGQAVPAGGYHIFSCATGFGGPVTVSSDKPVLASQRVQYYQSFNEVWAQAASHAATSLVLSWFDRVSSPGFLGDNIHVWNPTGAAFSAMANIPGCSAQQQNVAAGQEAIFTCATGYGGPVTVTSATALLASQRVQYYQSFNEVPAADGTTGSAHLYFAWYDHESSPGFIGDNIHVVNPTGALSPGQVTVTIPNCTPTPFQASASELIYSCPFGSGFGGPVTIVTTGVGVLASQRVQYYQSFNEVLAQT